MELIASELFSARVTVVPPPGEGDVTRYDHCQTSNKVRDVAYIRGSRFIKGFALIKADTTSSSSLGLYRNVLSK